MTKLSKERHPERSERYLKSGTVLASGDPSLRSGLRNSTVIPNAMRDLLNVALCLH
ncbi:hypothetical protein [Legionella bononiensis]|uniref:Uncharacterized protein n=1 Tax=Legionella bononiensis TaxID=2793102 RepID=A0ABS1WFC5_9GAMM|nr:hypothetical protein [Legionella bononiensis]MBL7528062.1 hypothetical protein [Legionella bononiensis]